MQRKLPLVTIIIPVHNKEGWICETLKSVQRQTYINWECIIIDDGSSDLSREKIQGFINSTPGNWIFLKVENMGQAKVRNLALAHVRGLYCAFLDGDDLWPQDKIENQLNFAIDNAVDLVLGPYLIFRDKHFVYQVSHKSISALTKGWMGMYGFGGALESGALIATEALMHHRFDETLSITSGLELFIRFTKTSKIGYCNSISLLYRLSENQAHKNIDALGQEMLQILSKHALNNDKRLLYNLNLFLSFPRNDSLVIKLKFFFSRLVRNPIRFSNYTRLVVKRKISGKLALIFSLRRHLYQQLIS